MYLFIFFVFCFSSNFSSLFCCSVLPFLFILLLVGNLNACVWREINNVLTHSIVRSGRKGYAVYRRVLFSSFQREIGPFWTERQKGNSFYSHRSCYPSNFIFLFSPFTFRPRNAFCPFCILENLLPPSLHPFIPLMIWKRRVTTKCCSSSYWG